MKRQVRPGDYSPGALCDIINRGRKVVDELTKENGRLKATEEDYNKQAKLIDAVQKRCTELDSKYEHCKNGDENEWPRFYTSDVERKIWSFGEELKNWARHYCCKVTMGQALADDSNRKLLLERVEPFTLLQGDTLPEPFKSLESEFMKDKACRTLLEGLVTHRVFKALLDDPFYIFNPSFTVDDTTSKNAANACSTTFKMMRLHDISSANKWRWETFRLLDPKVRREKPGQEDEIRKNVHRRKTKERTKEIIEAAANAIADATVLSAINLLISPEDQERATVKLRKITENMAQQAYIWATARIEIRVWDRECLCDNLPKPYYSGCKEFLTNDRAHDVELDKDETALDGRQVAVIINPAVITFSADGDPRRICYTDDYRDVARKAKVLFGERPSENGPKTPILGDSSGQNLPPSSPPNGRTQPPLSPSSNDQEPHNSESRRSSSDDGEDLHRNPRTIQATALWLQGIQAEIDRWGNKHCDVDTLGTTLSNQKSRSHLVDSVRDFVRLDSGDLPYGLQSASEKTTAILLIGLASHHVIGQPFGDPFFFEPDRHKSGLSNILARFEDGNFAQAQVWRAQTLSLLDPALRQDEPDYQHRYHKKEMTRHSIDHIAGLITETVMLTATGLLLTEARRTEARTELLAIARQAAHAAFALWTYKTRLEVSGLKLLHLIHDGVDSFSEVVEEFPFYTHDTDLDVPGSDIAMCVHPGIMLTGDEHGTNFSDETFEVMTKAAIWIDRPDVQSTNSGTYAVPSDSEESDIPPSDDEDDSNQTHYTIRDDKDSAESTNQAAAESTTICAACKTTLCAACKAPLKSTNQAETESVNQAEAESANQAGTEDTNEAGTENANQAEAESANQAGTEDTNEAGTENANQAGTENANQAGTGDANQAGTEDANQAGTEDANQAGIEDTNQAGTENANQAGTENANQAGTESTNQASAEEEEEEL